MRARLAAGLLQREVAERCTERGEKVDQSQVSQWEASRSAPLPPKLPVLAEVLGCSIDDLHDHTESSAVAS
jgi:transcriptional regulator with XRE-family HTH domain